MSGDDEKLNLKPLDVDSIPTGIAYDVDAITTHKDGNGVCDGYAIQLTDQGKAFGTVVVEKISIHRFFNKDKPVFKIVDSPDGKNVILFTPAGIFSVDGIRYKVGDTMHIDVSKNWSIASMINTLPQR